MGHEVPPELRDLEARALCVADGLRASVETAWEATDTPAVDCLFAIERCGVPYKNIRGRDISAHTEPIDSLHNFWRTFTVFL